MRVSILWIGVAALCAFTGAAFVSRAAADDLQTCARASGDEAIAACTRAIDSTRYNGKELAVAYYNRGTRYQRKEDYDRAIADETEAIRLDPANGGSGILGGGYVDRGICYRSAAQYDLAIADFDQAVGLDPRNAKPFYNRGVTYSSKGQFDRAVQDFDQAIGLAPNYANAFRERGRANLLAGALTEALADLDRAGKLAPRDAYAALWLDIAGRRNGLPSQMTQAYGQVDMRTWPAPVIQLFTGQSTPAAVLSAAENNGDANTRRNQVCEANFYGGEFALRSSSTEEAIRLFRLAAGGCPNGFSERDSAVAELKALGVAP